MSRRLVALVGEPGREVAADGTYQLSDEQARAILDLRLQRLTGLERDKIAEELHGLIAEIAGYLEILRSRARLIEVLRGELVAIKEQFATPRRTPIEDVEFEADIEALIQREEMVVTVSHAGYIKRVPLSTYRAQRRGGRGRAGMAIREEDFLSEVFVASTLAPVLFFTSSGRVYKLKVYRLPLGTPQARGRPMVNLLPNLIAGETISTVMPLPEDEESWADLTVMFATANGYVRRNALERFRRCPRQRQDRDEVRGRGCRRPADRRRHLHRRERCAARHAQRQGDPLSGRRCAGLFRPQFGRGARHPAARRRHGHLDVDPAPRGGRARCAQRLSEASPRGGGGRSARRARRRRRPPPEPEEAEASRARKRARSPRRSTPISRSARNSC